LIGNRGIAGGREIFDKNLFSSAFRKDGNFINFMLRRFEKPNNNPEFVELRIKKSLIRCQKIPH
jgi:hypothetical protein